MSDMKCPFCQQELDTGNYYVHCHNPHCNITVEMEGTEEMWEALIRTHKALDIAVDALKNTNGYLYGDYRNTKWDLHKTIRQALEQITELEQKDK